MASCFSKNKATVYLKHDLGWLFFAYEHAVLIGELKMLACGLCMAAYKKGSSGSKNWMSAGVFRVHPFSSVTFSVFQSPSLHLPQTFRQPSKGQKSRFLFFSWSCKQQSNGVSLKSRGYLTLTPSVTQTDVIKRLFIRSENPACLPVVLSGQFSLP